MKKILPSLFLALLFFVSCRNGENKKAATTVESPAQIEQIEQESKNLENTAKDIEEKEKALEEALKELE